MGYPSISQWIDTVSNPRGRFRTLGEFEPMRDAYGNVRFTAGNSAAVFPAVANGRCMMIKCFIKDGRDRHELYEITSGGDPLLSPTTLLPAEAYVYDDLGSGAFYDIAIGEWVDGNTLETEIRRAAREFGAPRFAQLAAIFDKLAVALLSRNWAHGDLKPDNIVVTPEGKAILIDYDAIYVPGGQPTGESGTPGFQHPARTENDYGKFIDDYPIALISVSLHALALYPDLYKKHHKGDGLILIPDEICSGKSEAYREILSLFADRGEYRLYELALKLNRPSPGIPELGKVMAKCTAAGHQTCTEDMPQLFHSAGLWGYRATDDNEVVGAIFDEAFEFSDGLAIAKLCGKWHVVDTGGNKVFCVHNATSVKPFSCGLAAFRRNGKWGYIDTKGTIVIEPHFDKACNMHDDIAAVCVDGKYGFVNHIGQIVIPLIYDHARGFRNGCAQVESNGEIFIIDLSGERV